MTEVLIAADWEYGARGQDEPDTTPPQQKQGKMKPKSNRAGDVYVPQGMDLCQTPAYALDPLLPYLPDCDGIWESAAGEGYLVRAFEVADYTVIGTDLLTGSNFFEWQPAEWAVQVTNPPYSIKYKWLARSYELDKPFALLLPVETLGAQAAQRLFERYGMELLLLDRRVNFKMPNKGFEQDGWKSAAQFPVAWFTWRLGLHAAITYGKLPKSSERR